MKRAFTLVELLVVIGMLAILMGAMGTSVAKSRTRAMIARATQETREMTNAILAYENYAPNRSLDSVANGGWATATEGSLGMIFGEAPTESGSPLPVLYNGSTVDPWGRSYEFIIKKAGNIASKSADGFITAPSLPNFYRLSDEERE